MDLISIIIIIAIISKVIKKGQETQDKKRRDKSNAWNHTAEQVKQRQSRNRQYTSSQNEEWKRLARENIDKVRRSAPEKLREVEAALELENKPIGTYQMPKQTTRTTPAYEQLTLQQVEQQRKQEKRSAKQQVHAGRMEARNTSILQRAKKNAEEDRVDITLETMEAEHNHSERVAPAKHHHPEDVISDSMLGTIEDLMVKGYDGNLCFERDFVGEAMDMISRFTVPSDVPDFSKDDVA